MSDNLREAYREIASDYLSRKSEPWQDFTKFIHTIDIGYCDIAMDIGAGNGRNFTQIEANHRVALDLSFQLLTGFAGPESSSKVVGSLPCLPFRRGVANNLIMIAVLHHLETENERIASMKEIYRIQSHGIIVLSVWRKWRKGVREKIFEGLRKGEDTSELFNVYRPWKSNRGVIIARRFYHYFTFKELRETITTAGFKINQYSIAGGRHKDANIFVSIKKKEIHIN